jgi:hypothetical protein
MKRKFIVIVISIAIFALYNLLIWDFLPVLWAMKLAVAAPSDAAPEEEKLGPRLVQ